MARLERRRGIRRVKRRILVLCEGRNTEPDYIHQLINEYHTESIWDIDVFGVGMSTGALLRNALERHRNHSYDRVWLVFDRDSFPDFNEAIHRAEEHGFHCAWSNEAFEIWYLLHFSNLDEPLPRQIYGQRITSLLGRYLGPKYRYRKNKRSSVGIYAHLRRYGNRDLAIRRAELLDLKRIKEGRSPVESNPCTLMYKLVRELQHPESIPL